MVFQKFPHILGLLRLHQGKQFLLLLLREVRQDVRRVVRGHLIEDVRSPLAVHLPEDVRLPLLIQLLQRVGGGLIVQGRDDLRALVVGEVLDDVGDLRRVQFREPVV